MFSKVVNGVEVYAPKSREALIEYAIKHQKILVAINAEKILHASDESRDVINRNLGYPDGIGAVWALKKKGVKEVVKIPGCELWLDIIKQNYKSKTFYLIGGKQEVLDQTVLNLKRGVGVLDMEVPAVPHVSKFSTEFASVPFQSRFFNKFPTIFY